MCNRLEFSPRYPNLRRFHVDLAENWFERLIDTRGLHGKGLLFSLYSKQCKATEYLSGPAAKEYFDSDQAIKENINVTWMDYSGYQEYAKLNPHFEHGVIILDLLFSAGPGAKHLMKYF